MSSSCVRLRKLERCISPSSLALFYRMANYILAVSVPFVALSLLSAALSVGFYAGCTALAFSVPSLNGHLRDTW